MTNKLILSIFFCLFIKNANAQIEVFAQTRGGIYTSYAKLLPDKGKPSPRFKVHPLTPAASIYSLYIEARYKKILVEVGYELISIGMAATDDSELYFCKDCETRGIHFIEYSVPMEVIPIRVGYELFSNKNFDLSSKIGYFYAYRSGGFMNEEAFSPYVTPQLIYSAVDGTPYTETSHNLQVGLDLAWKFGKKRRSAITVGLLYNHGLKVLGEDTVIFKRTNKPEESFENHTSRRGSFSGLVFGYRFRIFKY